MNRKVTVVHYEGDDAETEVVWFVTAIVSDEGVEFINAHGRRTKGRECMGVVDFDDLDVSQRDLDRLERQAIEEAIEQGAEERAGRWDAARARRSA